MTIGSKIIGGYAVILALLISVAATGLYSLNLVQGSYSEFVNVDEKLIESTNELKFKVIEDIAHFRAFLIYPNERGHYLEELRKDYQEFNAIIEDMRNRVVTKAGLAMLEEIVNLQESRKQVLDDVIALAEAGRDEEALTLNASQVLPIVQELIDKTKDFGNRQRQLVAEERAEVAATAKRNSTLMMFVTLFAMLTGLAIGLYLSRSITRQLRDSVAQLSAASAEILAVTTQVASGAAETATSVSETTTTVEEVKQTAQVASQKAKYVSERAQKATQIAHSGTKTVENALTGMYHIREQMESIAESIVGLNEQSQAIGEIIATVNNLAEQSNLLAVNAAIEAAKAGEHGKGFAVVAHEVRNLAGQSRQATAQVRTILGDIQKGTHSAVMATEQGSKAVESGLQQAREAGESISALADSIMEAAQAAVQIAASSQQQLVGMDQVALAMEDIKRATVQNVASARQVESASRNLNDLGQRLKQLVQQDQV